MHSAVFVTGGSGFLGQQLIRDLVAQGHSVRALARSEASARSVRAAGAQPVQGDLQAADSMRAGMQACQAVVHCAAKVEQWGAWDDFYRDTVIGTKNVVDAALAAGVPRFVHISTEAVLAGGAAIVNADETWPIPAQAIGFYPKSKAMAEQLVLAKNGAPLAGGGVLTALALRPRFIWGPNDPSLLPNLVQAAKKGWFWFGGGDHLMSTCHVRNVSHGICLALQNGRGGETYFLTDGEPVNFKSFIGQLIRSQGVEPGHKRAPMWVADTLAAMGEALWRSFNLPGEPPLTRTAVNLFFRQVTVLDAKARLELGYRPILSIAEALGEFPPAANSA